MFTMIGPVELVALFFLVGLASLSAAQEHVQIVLFKMCVLLAVVDTCVLRIRGTCLWIAALQLDSYSNS